MIKRLVTEKDKIFYLFFSWAIVAFGQPAWSSLLACFASLFGFACFWKVLIEFPERKKRFLLGTVWFGAVQLLQLSWSLSHPFYYIIIPYLGYALLWGVQFGLLSLLVDQAAFRKMSRILAIAAVWTLMEWSRLFVLSGFPFNPTGMALAGNILSLQTASLAGVFGMSFWVILTNLLALRARIHRSTGLFLIAALFPYLYGGTQLIWQGTQVIKGSKLNALLVQTAFPTEETLHFESHRDRVRYATEEWRQILKIISSHRSQTVDLIVFPENVVPFGTYTFVYSYDSVIRTFGEFFGEAAKSRLPSLEWPLASFEEGRWLVNNAYWVQGVANLFGAGVVAGLEDAENVSGKRQYYSAGIYIEPEERRMGTPFVPRRYTKRVLVPMGEYIPFGFLQELAAGYGVLGSFTPGSAPSVWKCGDVRFGVSICYEESFGELMRENRTAGAQMLLNLTNDAWYPHSKLIRQHFEHARLRTVETGIPLIRACNTGITGCVDSVGRDVALLGENDREREDLSASLFVQVPVHSYSTLYSFLGDRFILAISLAILIYSTFFRLRSSFISGSIY